MKKKLTVIILFVFIISGCASERQVNTKTNKIQMQMITIHDLDKHRLSNQMNQYIKKYIDFPDVVDFEHVYPQEIGQRY